MSYSVRVVMLTLLLDEYRANNPSVQPCIPPSTSIRVRLACVICSSKTFLFCAVKIKHSLAGRKILRSKHAAIAIEFLGNLSVIYINELIGNSV